jgi:hypothetical protein
MIHPVPSAAPRPLARERLLFPTLTLILLAACSSADADATKPNSALNGNDKRDTEIKHEDCNGNSASATKMDVNGDGKPDIIHVIEGGREVCRIVDLNLDGAFDSFIYNDAQGHERRRESDFDRDGRPDEIAISENGMIALKLRETNFDNKIDTWDYYQGGRLMSRLRDSDGDGIIDQWWQFNNPQNPKCAIVSSDRNTDGKPDPDSVVDLCGESYGAPKAAPSGPAPPPSAPSAPGAPGAPAPSPAPVGAAPGMAPVPPDAAAGKPAPGAPSPSPATPPLRP